MEGVESEEVAERERVGWEGGRWRWRDIPYILYTLKSPFDKDVPHVFNI